MVEDIRCLYVVGCNSWHANLRTAFDKNGRTWLQYNRNITDWFDRDFRPLLKKYGHFCVYGHTITTDYKFKDGIEYKPSTDKIICFNQEHVKLHQGIDNFRYYRGGKVSVVYKIDKQPRIFKEKHPPPDNTAPSFKAYDIEEGKCEITSPKCYKFAYETWLPVADIIPIPPTSWKDFRIGGGLIIDPLQDLKHRGIFPVALNPEHRELLGFD